MNKRASKTDGYKIVSTPTRLSGLIFLLAMIAAPIIESRPGGQPPKGAPLVEFISAVVTLSVLAGAISIAVDIGRAIHHAGKIRASKAVAGQRQANQRQVTNDAILSDLKQLYRRHEATLADQVRVLAPPDRYGVRDADAAAQEFSHFQDWVVLPALLGRGYDEDNIRGIFAGSSADLLRPVIARL